ncbi:hypothetical protein [Stutzerimonas azotifigens]|nr:hypothetical protein [Stutzerimonas azotifigens]
MVTLGFGLAVTAMQRFPLPGTDRTLLLAMAMCADCIVGLGIAIAFVIAT